MIPHHPLTVPEFIARWEGAQLTERSAAQQHFLDLRQVLGQPRMKGEACA